MRVVDAASAAMLLVDFIRRETRKARFSRAVLGLSGGVDSAVAAFLAVRALGTANVLCAMLPYRTSDPGALRDAGRLIRILKASRSICSFAWPAHLWPIWRPKRSPTS